MKFRAMAGLISVMSILLALVITGYAQQTCTESYGKGPNMFSLATGSPGELGLLKALGEAFAKKDDTTLCWVKAGSGESLQLLKDKKVDMIMVHAPEAEKKAVADGWAANRILIGSNEFYIVGPAADPAKIAQAKNVVDAYTRIASAKAKFFSRGDNSGTHKKEMDAWKKAGLTPGGEWYIVTKDFMTATLRRADAEKGYFMTDSSTWVRRKEEHARSHDTLPGRQISREHLSHALPAGRCDTRAGIRLPVHRLRELQGGSEHHPHLRQRSLR